MWNHEKGPQAPKRWAAAGSTVWDCNNVCSYAATFSPSSREAIIADAEDIAVGVLEPGSFHFSPHVHITLVCHAGHIVMLKLHPFGFELWHSVSHIINIPRGICRLIGTGILRLINFEFTPVVPGSPGINAGASWYGSKNLSGKFSFTRTEIARFRKSLDRVLIKVRPSIELNAVRDPKDNMILECAVEANAQLVITFDKDLLSIKAYENIQIAHPRMVQYWFPKRQ